MSTEQLTIPAPSGGRMTAAQGTALYIGAVLGTGVIALPGLAAQVAGPASLLAWLALVVLSAPLAAMFAALGSRHPDAGGVSTYARAAFGELSAVVVGWCFYFAIPVGAPAAALIAGGYVAAATGGGDQTELWVGGFLIAAVAVTNAAGLAVSARVQLVLAAVLLVFLATVVVLAAPHAQTANLHPFAPHGWSALRSASTLLVWSFAGWEAITSLAGEFRRPARDLPRATAAAVVVVGVLYLAVAWATVAVLGPSAGTSHAPLGDLLATSVGGGASTAAAVVAVVLTFGVMNAYFAGAAKLGAALSRDGALPPALHRGSAAGETPRRSLAVIALLSIAAFGIDAGLHVGVRPLVLAMSALLVTVYAVCVGAALRLLPRGSKAFLAAVLSGVAVLALLFAAGRYLCVPAVVVLLAVGYVRGRRAGHL